MRPHHHSAGFTLVEALVALVVLAIGMLGIAALYIETLRASRSAVYRTQAVTIAADLGERIRANRTAGAYACGDPCDPDAVTDPRAGEDLARWFDLLAAQLPEGAGAVEYTAATPITPSIYVITVSWTEVNQTDPSSYALRVEI